MFWMNPWALGNSMWQNAVAMQEIVVASEAVIRHRTKTIDSAIRNPLTADVAELGKMAPEKLAAFSQAGASLLSDMEALQADCFAQMRDLTAIALSGGVPSAKVLGRVGRRSSRILAGMSMAGGRAIKPIHATATANQRRLAKS